MLRLISQFDNEKIRVSSSTPTCGACCCCCCSCLISTLTISHLSGRNLSNLVKKQQLEETESSNQTKETRTAYLFGFFMPVILSLFIIGIFYVILMVQAMIEKALYSNSYFPIPFFILFIVVIGVAFIFIKFIKLSFYGFYKKYDFLKKIKRSFIIRIIFSLIFLILSVVVEFFASIVVVPKIVYKYLDYLFYYALIWLIVTGGIVIAGFIYIIKLILKTRKTEY